MSTARLLDGNLLIALVVGDHAHNEAAVDWFDSGTTMIATCPITEGTLIRFLIREGHDAATAVSVIEALRSSARHEFWSDDLPYSVNMMAGVIGHRQVTDAYLVGLARARSARVTTLDQGLAAVHGAEHVELLEA